MEEFLSFLSQPFFSIGNKEVNIGQLLIVPTLLLVGYYLINFFSRRLKKALEKGHVQADYILLLVRLYHILTYTLLAFTVLALLKVPLTAFAFVSGALAIAVGFGAQNILNNFISGWILMWERPIRIGDFLEIENVTGTVETINTRSTLIRRTDGVHMLIPNSHFLENTVVNWTLIDKMARGSIRVGVAYGSPTRKVKELLLNIAMNYEQVLSEPSPIVIFESFGDSALIFDLFFWINAFGERDLRLIKSEIRFRIDETFKQENIVIAFPQQDIHVDGFLKIKKED